MSKQQEVRDAFLEHFGFRAESKATKVENPAREERPDRERLSVAALRVLESRDRRAKPKVTATATERATERATATVRFSEVVKQLLTDESDHPNIATLFAAGKPLYKAARA